MFIFLAPASSFIKNMIDTDVLYVMLSQRFVGVHRGKNKTFHH